MDAGWLPLRGAGTPKEHKIQGCVTPNHHSPAAPELPSRGATTIMGSPALLAWQIFHRTYAHKYKNAAADYYICYGIFI